MTAPADLQSAIMSAIVAQSMVEIDGVKICRIDAGLATAALGIITASMIAAAPEASTPDGIKRLLRRQARRLEQQVTEFRLHAAAHGSPFKMGA